VSQIIRAGNVK